MPVYSYTTLIDNPLGSSQPWGINNAGQIVGIEVKATETVRTEDFRGLRLLQRRLCDRFRAGFVLYCGPDSLSFGDGLTCLPISALWTTLGRHESVG